MTAYENTLNLAFGLLDDLHRKMDLMAFNAFEADLYRTIGETYHKEVSQVRADMEDFWWMISETED